MVHPKGVEPSRHRWHKNLNLACLPIPPRVQIENALMFSNQSKNVNAKHYPVLLFCKNLVLNVAKKPCDNITTLKGKL